MSNKIIQINGKTYHFDAKDLVFKAYLGASQTGNVEKYFHVPSQTLIAVKCLSLRKRKNRIGQLIEEQQKVEKLKKEYEMLKSLQHFSHIIQVYGFIQTPTKVYFCMELLDRDLDSTKEIFHETSGRFLESLLLNIVSSIVNALDFCHHINILHRDIKPKNILMNMKSVQVKLGDFGEACLENEDDEKVGTPLYWPPEYLGSKSGQKSEVWSLGITLLELIKGDHPFVSKVESTMSNNPIERHTSLAQNLLEENGDMLTQMIEKAKCSIEAKEFLKSCLKLDVKDRMSYEQLKQTKYYQENFEGKYYTDLVKNLEETYKLFNQGIFPVLDQTAASKLKEALNDFTNSNAQNEYSYDSEALKELAYNLSIRLDLYNTQEQDSPSNSKNYPEPNISEPGIVSNLMKNKVIDAAIDAIAGNQTKDMTRREKDLMKEARPLDFYAKALESQEVQKHATNYIDSILKIAHNSQNSFDASNSDPIQMMTSIFGQIFEATRTMSANVNQATTSQVFDHLQTVQDHQKDDLDLD